MIKIKKRDPKLGVRGGVDKCAIRLCFYRPIMTYECALESLKHSSSNDGLHVSKEAIPVIFRHFEKKVHAYLSYIA